MPSCDTMCAMDRCAGQGDTQFQLGLPEILLRPFPVPNLLLNDLQDPALPLLLQPQRFQLSLAPLHALTLPFLSPLLLLSFRVKRFARSVTLDPQRRCKLMRFLFPPCGFLMGIEFPRAGWTSRSGRFCR